MLRGLRLLSLAAILAGTLAAGESLALEQMGMAVNGQPRSYLMERPAAPGPLPTMIVLHGLGGSAEETARASGLAPFGDQQGFVTVFPDGVNHAWNHLPPGKTPPAYIHLLQSKGLAVPDDVAFLRMLVGDLVRRGISDPGRIYLVGISAGGFMTLRMTCVDPGLFAGIALVITGMPQPTGDECHPDKPMPVVMIKGTADPNVPWDGGFVKVHTFAVWPQERLFGFLRQLDGCADAPEQSVLPNQTPFRVELVRWTKCSSGDPVVLYRVINGVHAVPPVPELRETLWSFLRDKSRGAGASGAVPAPRAAAVQQPSAPAFAQAQSPAQSPAPSSSTAATPGAPAPGAEEVTFQSNGYTLAGCIIRPAGPGPFPAVIYNHGSEKDPRRCGPPELARAYLEHGYAFFAFQRHGHGQSPGDYIVDLEKKLGPGPAHARRAVALHEAYNRDVVGAVEWLMRRPEIDRHRVAMTGVSYGGIQTLLTAEKGLGIRAFLPFAPGAMSWANQALDQRLAQAVRNAKAPLFLAQAQNDFSLGPSQVLGPIIRAKGAPNDAKVYPPNGTTHEDGHGGFAVRGGIPEWSADVFGFLERVMGAAGR